MVAGVTHYVTHSRRSTAVPCWPWYLRMIVEIEIESLSVSTKLLLFGNSVLFASITTTPALISGRCNGDVTLTVMVQRFLVCKRKRSTFSFSAGLHTLIRCRESGVYLVRHDEKSVLVLYTPSKTCRIGSLVSPQWPSEQHVRPACVQFCCYY